ncbi:MAG: transglutaminase N-terminal domain-containing protein, partial [Acidimicrobiales bacterium]
MRLDIRYRTTFTYDDVVRESQNELRACPSSDESQQLISYRVSTSPSSRVLSYTDYWGTRVDAFGVREPHIYIEVIAEATVETHPSPMLTASSDMSRLQDLDFLAEHFE